MRTRLGFWISAGIAFLLAGCTANQDSTIESNVERYLTESARAVNARDWEAYGSLFTEDLLMFAPGFPGTRGRDARLEMVQGIMAAFPDGRVDGQRAFGKGEWACFQFEFSGTNTGPLAAADGSEIPATNKPVKFSYCIVARYEAGQIAELHEYFNQMDLLTQLGLVP